jgi:hypothetical protein
MPDDYLGFRGPCLFRFHRHAVPIKAVGGRFGFYVAAALACDVSQEGRR